MKNISDIEDLLTVTQSIHRAKRNIILPIIYIIAGIVAIIIAPNFDKIDSLMMTLYVGGASIITIGAIKCLLPSKKLVYAKTKEAIEPKNLYFDATNEYTIKELLVNGKFEQLKSMASKKENGPQMVTYYSTPSGSFYIAQIYKFVPYHYIPFIEPIVTEK
ncbi:MAG: hypothetical protein PHR45_00085 [Muribaculaceae bacterium]|nr:hypothetical protein [Muribaculaceae bacterium]